ncbi:hypothetical protein Rin_00009570 [Candidatus Regiella insecticola 5.15]|uniref:Toxin CptA n=2 Tax=Candidatus Regiella insecticola TaxID=138073 RepID=G2GYU6_9ENTR|nr:protein YgfX [Candidatus Regiella insecticola]EGY29080.1 hypothetical protein Rin_00009570 [Candidatus Regiella insecticola 5.15]
MARWQCELRVSLRTRWFSFLMYVGLACLILLTPWPTGGAVVCFLLLTLITFEYFQRQIKYRPMMIKLNADNVLEWNQQQWNIIQPPWITHYGVLLALKQQANHKIYPQPLKLPLGGQGVRPMSVDDYVIRRTPAANNAATSKAKGIYQRLWLASDSMTEREWRMLCQLMRGLGDCE